MLKLGQKFGLGLGPKLLASASASKLSGLGLEVLASASRLARTAHVWLLPHVNRSFRSQAPMNRPNMRYITYIYINSDTFDHSSSELAKLYCDFSLFSVLQPLFA